MSGKIDKTDFECSELYTQYETTSTDSDGDTTTTWHTIFKGLFFHADFNKNFIGKTYISPDFSESLFGSWGRMFQKIGSKAPLVQLENVEFEKIFAVHGTDQVEARYILTPTIMEALVKVSKTYERPIHLSFVDSRVFCAISFNEDLFEPKIWSSGVDFKDVKFIYDLFNFNRVIIEELNLNTRIWTKS